MTSLAGIPGILAPYLKGMSRDRAEKVLAKRRAGIVDKAEDEDPVSHGPRFAVRWMLYWQCKALLASVGLRSGTLADLWRDIIDEKIVAAVPEVTDDGDAYDKTAAALVALVW